MDYDQRKKEVNEFFKEKLRIDFNDFSPVKARMVVDRLNQELDEQLRIEKERNEQLTQEIYTERNRIIELTKEVYS